MTVLTALDRLAAGEVRPNPAERIALLSNQVSRAADGRWAFEVLRDAGFPVTLLLGPEHGLDASAAAGAHVGHGRLGDIPVLSLYGADQAPVEEALDSVDRIMVDLPDVGARYYTYPWTVRETMRMAARHDVRVTILDRPNPLGGENIEGNIAELDSAVSSSPVPIRHGLTLGELSLWNCEMHSIPVALDVIPVMGWRRSQYFDETGLPWVSPSPNLNNLEATLLYPGTCLVEGTTLSEGRGTDAPFRQLGSPRLDADGILDSLRGDDALAGLALEKVSFTPSSSKWAGEECRGLRLTVTDRQVLHPVRAGLALIGALRQSPDFAFLPFFDNLAGTKTWRERLSQGAEPEAITDAFRAGENAFRNERQRVLLY